MLLIVVILMVAYVVVPLLDLVLKEGILTISKIVVYAVTLAWLLYTLFVGRMV